MTSIAERARVAAPAPDPRAARRARAKLADRVMTGVLWGLAAGLAALLAAMLIFLIVRGIGVLNWQFLTTQDNGGDGAALYNTFYIIVLALAICLPLATSAAIYLVEYARQGPFVSAIRFATETLAGIPSIILGLFGFLVFVTQFGTGARFGTSRLAGALTLVILNLPLLLRVSEDALRSVPNDLREASAAVGANRFQTVWRVLLPAALPSLTTGVILTAGKMMGETAALIFTSGGNSPAVGWLTLNPLTVGDTLTVHMYEAQAEGVLANSAQIAAGTATLLIILLLIFNLGIRGLSGLLNRRLAGRLS